MVALGSPLPSHRKGPLMGVWVRRKGLRSSHSVPDTKYRRDIRALASLSPVAHTLLAVLLAVLSHKVHVQPRKPWNTR